MSRKAFGPESTGEYAYWLGVSPEEATSLIDGTVPDAVKHELRELIVLLDETPAEKAEKRKRKKRAA